VMTPRASTRNELSRGVRASLPLAPGVAAFGLLYGMMARQVGLSAWQALAMSVIVHAGSAQFIALGMWGVAGTGPIILTTLVVNLRHLLLGASVAPYLRSLPARWKAALAYYMSDESYALTMAEYEKGTGSHGFFLGTNMGICLMWWCSGWLGAVLGTTVPDPSSYGLDLVFPLAFTSLLMAFLKDRIHVAVAVLSALLALLAAQVLPGKWYVIVAGLAGSGAGVLVEEARRRWTQC
jgi:4-azaleucine resistance transporter AzlC